MKFIGKDGGPESHVHGWFFEIKHLFTVALLRFEQGSREAFHSHAFNSVSFVLKGALIEQHLHGQFVDTHTPGLVPVVTRRSTFHKVTSYGRTWVLTFRGPWARTWQEYIPATDEVVTLTNGRVEVDRRRA